MWGYLVVLITEDFFDKILLLLQKYYQHLFWNVSIDNQLEWKYGVYHPELKVSDLFLNTSPKEFKYIKNDFFNFLFIIFNIPVFRFVFLLVFFLFFCFLLFFFCFLFFI